MHEELRDNVTGLNTIQHSVGIPINFYSTGVTVVYQLIFFTVITTLYRKLCSFSRLNLNGS